MNPHDELRKLPSVDRALGQPEVVGWDNLYGRDLVVEAVRAILGEMRREIRNGAACPEMPALLARVDAHLMRVIEPTLRPVINATGVIIHTNLGRSPLSDDVIKAMSRVGRGYSNLEFDLDAGRRGSRYYHAEALLCRLTGAEAALLVNNNAGAVMLTLSTLAREREVIISRGQLVEIGGGFRIPDVMAQSGARLVEVGTTNRTYARDYEAAIGEDTAALMRAHSSNFRVIGFTHQPDLADLVALAHRRDVLMLDDLGSGTLLDTATYGLLHEPTIQDGVSAGVDIVTFSGDKLLGGPQAGIIVGRTELVEQLRHAPLTRALRVDKTTIAGIQTNLLHYVKGEALSHIPIWRMISASQEDVEERAEALLASLGAQATGCELVPGRSMVGGGSLPEESLPTMLLALPAGETMARAATLRTGRPAVVGRVLDERVVLDLRTVLPAQEAALVQRLRAIL